MTYGHAERNLALIRQLEAETRQLENLEQPDAEQSAWLQDSRPENTCYPPLHASGATGRACSLLPSPAGQPSDPQGCGRGDSLNCSMYRTLAKANGFAGSHVGSKDHRRPATPGNCEQSSPQFNHPFGDTEHHSTTPRI
jgi:hypothetical protein